MHRAYYSLDTELAQVVVEMLKGDRLRDSHRAPQPLMPGLQPLEPCQNLIDSRWFEESSQAIHDEACAACYLSLDLNKDRAKIIPWIHSGP